MARNYTRVPLRLPLSALIPAAESSDSDCSLTSSGTLMSSLSVPFVLAQACRQPVVTSYSRRLDKPLPARPGISAKQIAALLELLARMDGDVAAEVRRVQYSIREARAFVRDERDDQIAREEQAAARLAQTREAEVEGIAEGIDDEVWLGI